MSLKNIKPDQIKELFTRNIPFVDVRAPVEFHQGSLPGAMNMPIMNDEERARVGSTYKREGQEAAVKLGHELVSGAVKEERVEAWKAFFEQHPQAILYCFRGGKRSQITQQWLREAGLSVPLITGGYKAVRSYLMKQIEEFSVRHEMIALSGPTGSGKTHLLHRLRDQYPVIDLEHLARHRGSAFGAMDLEQPTQIDYENQLARELMLLEDKIVGGIKPVVEDESRLIGRIYQPATFFIRLRASSVVWIDEPMHVRVENVFGDYVLQTPIGLSVQSLPRCQEEEDILRSEAVQVFEKYRRSVMTIHRKLGGLRCQEVIADLDRAQQDYLNHQELSSNKVWIEKLLSYYYDPLYLGSLDRRQVNILFKGNLADAEKYLLELVGK